VAVYAAAVAPALKVRAASVLSIGGIASIDYTASPFGVTATIPVRNIGQTAFDLQSFINNYAPQAVVLYIGPQQIVVDYLSCRAYMGKQVLSPGEVGYLRCSGYYFASSGPLITAFGGVPPSSVLKDSTVLAYIKLAKAMPLCAGVPPVEDTPSRVYDCQ